MQVCSMRNYTLNKSLRLILIRALKIAIVGISAIIKVTQASKLAIQSTWDRIAFIVVQNKYALMCDCRILKVDPSY